MSRIKASKKQQLELQKHFGIDTEEKRQKLTIGILCDIADSLAVLCDLYAMTHGITLADCKMVDDDADGE